MRSAITATVIAAAMLLTGCSSDSQTDESAASQSADVKAASSSDSPQQDTGDTVDVPGTLTTPVTDSGSCRDEYGNPVMEGDRISIVNFMHETLARSELGVPSVDGDRCTFEFTFPEVSTDEDFYAVVFGSSQWGMDYNDLKRDNWIVHIAIY